ncbi:MAG: hypothetical protein AB7J13_01655 [Pyrinomonadaceae bacterium]
MKNGAIAFLLATIALSSPLSAQTNDRDDAGLKPFVTDNCSFFPDGNYADCCVAHDKQYWAGGSNAERKEADKRLKQCVRARNKGWKGKLLSNAMYLGVRIGGVHWLPTPFRWGFGNKWPKKGPELRQTVPKK